MISVAEFKSYMRITSTQTDSVIADYIDYASELINNYCQTPMKAVTVDYSFDKNGAKYKVLPYSHVRALNSSYYRDTPMEAWSEIDAYLHVDNGVFMAYNGDGFNRNHYKLNLDVGYSVLPDDVKLVCTEIVATIWNDSNLADNNEGRLGLATQSVNTLAGLSQTTTYKDLTSRWTKILTKYKVPTC